MPVKTVLPGVHVSPETAYLVDDYPYGFTLRCKIRYWLEIHPSRGVRLASQTTNPKRGDVWNKPKFSTYARFAGAMYLDENEHVHWIGCHEYMDLAQVEAFCAQFRDGVPEACRDRLAAWLRAKRAYEAARANGQDMATAAATASIAAAKGE